MTREDIIRNLKYTMEKHKNDTVNTFDTNISAMCKDILDYLEHEPTVAQERYEDLCEYFGGAKDFLNSREDFKAWLERIKWHIHKAEELYEKYEQEPCNDAISRQAVLDVLKDTWNMFSDANDAMQESIDTIEALLPVNPQVKTGYWMHTTNDFHVCSSCGKLIKQSYLNFCANCGCHMVEPQESEEA